jgi:hypothetical protein
VKAKAEEMIDPTELRIGNLICWNPRLINPNATLPAMPVRVSAILQDKIGYTSPNYEHRVEPFEDDKLQMEMPYRSLNELEPLTLTTEILKGANFKKESGSLFKHKGHELYFDVKKNTGFYLKKKFSFNNLSYVHHLQNIYFTLTGNELEIGMWQPS